MRPTPIALLIAPLLAAACSSGASGNDGAADAARRTTAGDDTRNDSAPDRDRLGSNDTPTATRPVAGEAPRKSFVGAAGLVRLTYPATLTPSHDFHGMSLMSAGWRPSWDGSPTGPGTGVVRFSEQARPTEGEGLVDEMVQVGLSRDPGVVAQCGTTGTQGGSTRRLPNRMLGGHRWTVWGNGDAGMSQQIDATDLRTVVDGVCYAVERVTYRVAAADPLPASAPTQAAAAARMDAILASVQVGPRR